MEQEKRIDLKTVTVTLTGKMPLLMHADNIDWADQMEEWKNNPNNKSASKAGDDRTPTWRWIGCLNYDDPKTGIITIPSEYVMSCLMGGAAQVPTGKGTSTFKALSQSGMICSDFHWPLLVNGKPIAMKDINVALTLDTFKEQVEYAAQMGFSLFVRRARVGTKKHIRVRPRFDNWSTVGQIMILDKQITVDKVLPMILDIAGRLKGLGDWRPGGPKPGPFGTFDASIS
jgi:hypothetical protein